MATALNTISMLKRVEIPKTQLISHTMAVVQRLKRNSTNKYLSKQLGELLNEWQKLL